jgi:hypothetical protein
MRSEPIPEGRGGIAVAAEEKLKRGGRAPFAKSRMKHLPKSDDSWEVDFQELPRPMTQAEPQYLGLVVAKGGTSPLAELLVQRSPTVNDLATILAHAMVRPPRGDARRPRRVHVRGRREWKELFPVLEEVGVEVAVGRSFPGVKEAHKEYVRQMREERKAEKVDPSAEQESVESLFPAVARYVRGHGSIEIGVQESFGFVVRAISYGGVDFEDDTPDTLSEALAVLEAGLVKWFKEEQGEEVG